MQSNTVNLTNYASTTNSSLTKQLTTNTYEDAEREFVNLLEIEDLDTKIATDLSLVSNFEKILATAITEAYEQQPSSDAAHLFLQRILYRINRLKFFWYDDLRHYTNERSIFLQIVHNQIETPWQAWELAQINVAALQQLEPKQALIERAAFDLNPPLAEESRYIREEMTEKGYRHLLAIASLDGLVEASQLSRILGGAANEIQATLTRVLIEEYGNGRLSRKHSTFFTQMLAELGMHTEPEAYFDLVPWQVLASINQSFLLTECKRHFLRYNGGLAYFEVAGPAVYRNYVAAVQRLQLSATAMGYWELHIKEDERHGRWMIDDVALPLVEKYPNNAWEIVLGYDQGKFMSERAGNAVVKAIREAE
jgi:hypothetical protein